MPKKHPPPFSPEPIARVSVDRLIRGKSILRGSLGPTAFPALRLYLAAEEGVVDYAFSASSRTDILGKQSRRLQCIISGWFSVLDPQTLESKRFSLEIESRLVLVSREQDLPALEEEEDDEDVIVCGAEFDLIERLQEEILLALPVDTPQVAIAARAGAVAKRGEVAPNVTPAKAVHPFAKLAGLKTTNLN